VLAALDELVPRHARPRVRIGHEHH
jgi:hypothetical protein